MLFLCFYFAFFCVIIIAKREGRYFMKSNITELKPSDITSEVFLISKTQIDFISANFGDAMAEALNLKSLSYKFRKIAADTLVKALNSASTMGGRQ